MSVSRIKQLHRKWRRRRKLAFLRQKFEQAKTQGEKAKILEKVAKVAPTARLE